MLGSHSQQRGRPCNLWHSAYDASYIGARLVSGGPQTQSGRTATSHPFPELGARPGLHELSAEAEGDQLFSRNSHHLGAPLLHVA